LHEDQILAIIEVKPQDMGTDAAHEQVSEYFEAVVDKIRFGTSEPLFDRLDGLLVLGREAKLVTLTSPGGVIQFSQAHDITGMVVHNFLRNIASSHW
jgi:hypothetical protein